MKVPSFCTPSLNTFSQETEYHQVFSCVKNSYVFAYLHKPVLKGHRLCDDVSITALLEVHQKFKFQTCCGELNMCNRDFSMQTPGKHQCSRPESRLLCHLTVQNNMNKRPLTQQKLADCCKGSLLFLPCVKK